MRDVYEHQPVIVPIPESLKPGKYLLRHEMINLETGDVQVFVNCVQVDVKGGGNSIPEQKDLVAFPGAYDAHFGKVSSDIEVGILPFSW
jgi:lytic cellulose monooxygenase (C1-hydroxylating)